MTNLKSLFTIAIVLLAKPAFPDSFPTTVVPFTSIASKATSPNGDLLTLGYTSSGTQLSVNALLLPCFDNEQFTDALVRLAPSQYFSNVYIPTPAERTGDYSSFAGILIDPISNTPFPNDFIPASRLFGNNGLYAFRVRRQPEAAPEPATFGFISLAGLAACLFGMGRLLRKSERSRGT